MRSILFTLILLVGCNEVKLELGSLGSLVVKAPALMLTGHCTEWTVERNEKHQRRLDSSLSVDLGASVEGTKFYLNSSCTQETTNLTFTPRQISKAFYVRQNLNSDLQVTAMKKSYVSTGETLGLSMDFTRLDLLAGVRESFGSLEGFGTSARFDGTRSMVSDGTYIYVAAYRVILRINPLTKYVEIFAGDVSGIGTADGIGNAARFNGATGITFLNGYLYVADQSNYAIRQIDPATRNVVTVAGLAGTGGGTNGVGSAARFWSVYGITHDGTNLYVTDNQRRIRKIDPTTFTVTTFAGASTYGLVDGVGGVARFRELRQIVSDGTFIYAADSGNHVIRRIEISTATVTTIAGTASTSGVSDGPALGGATFDKPTGISIDGTKLYIADQTSNTIRVHDLVSGMVSTLAGSPGSTDDYIDGAANFAKFSFLQGLSFFNGKLYIFEGLPAIRTFDPATSIVETVYGVYTNNSWATVDGAGSAARFDWVDQFASDGKYIYAGDCGGHAIRRMSIATGVVETIAGKINNSGYADGVGSDAQFNCPFSVAYESGSLYIFDENFVIRKLDLQTRNVVTIAGQAGVSATADGIGTAATFRYLGHLAVLGNDLYFSDFNDDVLRKMDLDTFEVTTVAGTLGVSGNADGIGTAATFEKIFAITILNGLVYLMDMQSGILRTYDPMTNEVTTVAGSQGVSGAADGFGNTAQFNSAYSLTSDGSFIYIADMNNHLIRKYDPVTTEVSTLAGSRVVAADQDSEIASSTLTWPAGLVWTSSGLFFSNDGLNISWIH